MNKHRRKDIEVFLAFIRAGLWEQHEHVHSVDEIDFTSLMQLAKEQSLMGLILAGIEGLPKDRKPSRAILLEWFGQVQAGAQRNIAMNDYLSRLAASLREEKVDFVLVKGQGIAQCYDKPLWRACGDIDLLLDNENYQRAKILLSRCADVVHKENLYDKHFSVKIEGWTVELHGSLRSLLTKRADEELDVLQEYSFKNKRFRFWNCCGVEMPIACADSDVLFVFTHILKHFFHYGIGLRQICDWCRLLWTYRSDLDIALLRQRLKRMGLMSEWKAFAALAVDYLGMPEEGMPFYSAEWSWKRKARRVLSYVIDTGNFGHNRNKSYFHKYPFVLRKAISLMRHTYDSVRHFFIFPLDAIRIWLRLLSTGLGAVTEKQ